MSQHEIDSLNAELTAMVSDGRGADIDASAEVQALNDELTTFSSLVW